MKTAAIIAEYNPFHNGHNWQLNEIRSRLGDGCGVIAVMSGCMTQRGEPALFDKWARARMALAAGVSLVIELPFAYAAASAERFARGGVQLVAATGLDCDLVFGSECGDLAPLDRLAGLLADETPAFRALLRKSLDAGESFPAARQMAVAGLTGDPGLAALLETSNNILAVEYLKALRQSGGSRIRPMTLPRQGQAYNDDRAGFVPGSPASAAAIRRLTSEAMRSGEGMSRLALDLPALVPAPALAVMLNAVQDGPGPLFAEDLALPVLAMLRALPPEQIELVPGMGEGLGRRLAAAARRPSAGQDGLMASLLADAGTRRFPQTRIQRALLAMLAGLRAEDLALFDESGGPQYLRVLGFDKQGRHLLKLMRRRAQLPILMNASDALEYKAAALVRMAELDTIAADLWMLAAKRPCGRDFDTPAVMR